MRPEDLRKFVRKRPFFPFRIYVTDGQTYDIRHPDQIIVLRSRAVVGAGSDSDFPEHLEHIALVHIVRIKEVSPETRGA